MGVWIGNNDNALMNKAGRWRPAGRNGPHSGNGEPASITDFGEVGVVSSIRYETRIRDLVEGFPRLAAIIEPLLTVRRVMVSSSQSFTSCY